MNNQKISNLINFENEYHNKYLNLLFLDSIERNKAFNNFTLNDIYILYFLSSGIVSKNIKNNSLKILHKYILYVKQYNLHNFAYNIYIIEKMYNYLLNYDATNKTYISVTYEIEEILKIYNNYENFRIYINSNHRVGEILASLVNKPPNYI